MTTHTKRLDLFYWITIPTACNAGTRRCTPRYAERTARRINRLSGAVGLMQLAILRPFAPILAPGLEA